MIILGAMLTESYSQPSMGGPRTPPMLTTARILRQIATVPDAHSAAHANSGSSSSSFARKLAALQGKHQQSPAPFVVRIEGCGGSDDDVADGGSSLGASSISSSSPLFRTSPPAATAAVPEASTADVFTFGASAADLLTLEPAANGVGVIEVCACACMHGRVRTWTCVRIAAVAVDCFCICTCR